jgi:Putative Actinobacterial Holin-X, holin superfamily III
MAEPAERNSAGAVSQESVGGLVSLAVKDITQLIRSEIELAKMEAKVDLRRIGIGAALFGLAAFVGCLILMLLCFGLAYGLMTLGVWDWAAFLLTAAACLLLALVAAGVGLIFIKRFAGLPRTRRTVSDDIAVLRHADGAGAPPRTPVR